mmetsp:Transcript_46805/g.101671  ORF Transcript_46805/g.101671 Transcript_46805/m.101671 type:complete len:110 (+) Transcript_46805:183-512(+)
MFQRTNVSRLTLSGHEAALVDLVVLSMTDHLVTSAMSTFGAVAAALHGSAPLVITFHGTCLRELSSEPCFHKWTYLQRASCYNRLEMISEDVRFCGPLTPPVPLPEDIW